MVVSVFQQATGLLTINMDFSIELTTIAVSAFLTCAGYIYKISAEKNQTRKQVLYFLLEFRLILIKRINQKQNSQRLNLVLKLAASKAKDVVNLEEQELEAILNAIPKDFKEHWEAAIFDAEEHIASNVDPELVNGFHQALKALSRDNPVLAYRLRDIHKLEQAIDAVERYKTSMTGLEAEFFSEDITAIVSDALSDVAEQTDNHLLESMNSAIKLIVPMASIFLWWQCLRVKKRQDEQLNLEPEMFFTQEEEGLIEPLVNFLIEQVRQQTAATS